METKDGLHLSSCSSCAERPDGGRIFVVVVLLVESGMCHSVVAVMSARGGQVLQVQH